MYFYFFLFHFAQSSSLYHSHETSFKPVLFFPTLFMPYLFILSIIQAYLDISGAEENLLKSQFKGSSIGQMDETNKQYFVSKYVRPHAHIQYNNYQTLTPLTLCFNYYLDKC